jgi:ankyrin repeat protein
MIQDWQVAKEKFENDIGELIGPLFNVTSTEKALDYVRRMSSLVESIDLVDPMMLNKCKKATVADDAVLEGDVQVALEALVVQCEAKMLEREEKLHREAEEKVLQEAAWARNEKLYEACKKGALAEVCTALEVDGGVDVNYKCDADKGQTSLIIASRNGHAKVVSLLLQADGILVNLGAKSSNFTALFIASQEGHVDVVRLLLGVEGVEVNQANNNGSTALIFASQEGHVEVVRLLLGAEGVEVNQADNDGSTALICASFKGHVEVIRLLLGAEGVEVNQAASNGVTALIWASQQSHLDIVRLLTDAGAN